MKMKKIVKTLFLINLIIISFVSKSVAQNNTNLERKQRFNFDWKFALGDAAENSAENFDDTTWRKLDLPHDWSIEGKSEKNNPSGGDGGFYPTGTGWYRKTFSAPTEWKSQKIVIYFEGVYMNAEVFINGKSVGIQPYGYTSFEYDLTPYLKLGQQNTIAVKVDNSQQKNCRWYSGSGIYRNVWLMVKNPVHVKNWGVAISTLEVKNNKAVVGVKTIIKNETPVLEVVMLSTAIIDGKGKTVANKSDKIELQPNEEKEVIQTIDVENHKLWSLETPNRYQAKVSIAKESKSIDVVTIDFGIRTIKFSAENGFVLNDKKILLNGGCVHHDNGALGSAAYDRAEERKVE